MKTKVFKHFSGSVRMAVLASACIAGMTFVSCADDDIINGGNDEQGTAVAFNVSTAENDAKAETGAQVAKAPALGGMTARDVFSRQLEIQSLAVSDLAFQQISVEGGDGNTCLMETTTPGVDMKIAHRPAPALSKGMRRANITTMATLGKFSSYGYKGTSETTFSPTPDWFYNRETNSDGTLATPAYWHWAENHFGKFYAIYPQVTDGDTRFTVSPATYAGTPYVNFEVEPDVKNQKDLMTAYSGVVEYETNKVAPTTHLRFRHALTAVRFKVGQNLSYDKKITKIEIVNAMSKGKYTLPTSATGTGTWDTPTTPATFTLGGDGTVSASTKEAVNNIIVGKPGDNYTFYMIPQELTGKNVTVKIYFDDNHTTPAITATLKGSWKPGTTKTYALSQNTSTWVYQIEVTSPAPAAYDETKTGNYTVKSYRRAPDGTLEAVPWTVIGYDNDNNGTFNMNEKPDWLRYISTDQGNGGTTVAETGTATLTKEIVDVLHERDDALKAGTVRGASGDYYDLSKHDIKGNDTPRNTANSYLISGPGHYKIPLVYGNAIKNGVKNEKAYISNAQLGTDNDSYILRHFKDHADINITDPWITKTNNGANAPNNAKLVWADEKNLVTGLGIEGSDENAYVHFEVTQSNLKQGNAVIAVTKDDVVVWSWHLWFAPQYALDTTPLTNLDGDVNNVTNETLGFKYLIWRHSAYSTPRSVKMKVEQTIGQAGGKQTAIITITQNNGNTHKGNSTLYQFGRKDALPGTDEIKDGSYSADLTDGGHSIGYAIQHPENMFKFVSKKKDLPNKYDWCNATYCNLWSADNTETDYSDNNVVVKTIYDPCPAGFRLPASKVFSSFNTSGQSGVAAMNISGNWDYGWHFNNKPTNPNATLYFPATGFRYADDCKLFGLGDYSTYWTAIPSGTFYACGMYMTKTSALPMYDKNYRASGYSIRPVVD